jgi:phospholipid/cholesterol/gamma-HCH transport system substrate-binding protein
MRRGVLVLAAAVAMLCMAGCANYKGINSLLLPGDVGTGKDSYLVTMKLQNAANLVPNTPVLINDINVGTVTKVALDGWTPVLTLSLRRDAKLPANAVASLGQTSLLGSKHIELSSPTDVRPEGTLLAGAQIPEDRTKHFPETEEVLAGVSLLLNGGGLQHFQTITSELNRALGGRENDARDFLTQLNDFTSGLDKQKDDIVTAIKSLDRFGGALAPRMSEIDIALRQLPGGLGSLNENYPEIKDAIDTLGSAGDPSAPFSDSISSQIRELTDQLEPVLRHIADTQQDSVLKSLKILPFVIFPLDQIPYEFRGDYLHIIATVDLTDEALDRAFLTGTPAAGALGGLAKLQQGKPPGLQAADPLQLPLGQQESHMPTRGLPSAPELSADQPGGASLDKPLRRMGG